MSNIALASAPWSVTLCKDGALYTNAVYGNENAAINAFKKTVEALGGTHEEAAMEEGFQVVGSFTVYFSANGDTDDLLSYGIMQQ
jgi:hypothetical protein